MRWLVTNENLYRFCHQQLLNVQKNTHGRFKMPTKIHFDRCYWAIKQDEEQSLHELVQILIVDAIKNHIHVWVCVFYDFIACSAWGNSKKCAYIDSNTHLQRWLEASLGCFNNSENGVISHFLIILLVFCVYTMRSMLFTLRFYVILFPHTALFYARRTMQITNGRKNISENTHMNARLSHRAQFLITNSIEYIMCHVYVDVYILNLFIYIIVLVK